MIRITITRYWLRMIESSRVSEWRRVKRSRVERWWVVDYMVNDIVMKKRRAVTAPVLDVAPTLVILVRVTEIRL